MLKKIFIGLLAIFVGHGIYAADISDTRCATAVFADALAAASGAVSETDHETVIRAWIYKTLSDKSVLTAALACPELANADDGDVIKFQPIEYTFPGGRRIVVNYETVVKVLKQRLLLADKRGTPDSGAASADVGGDGAIWTNVDPAWYAIMVVEGGALDSFVGADKNNTISLSYIRDNIDALYPADHAAPDCTSRSGSEMTGGNDNDIVNVAAHKTVNLDDDTNDYYVAGDINLQWISYAEIALDVVITVATFGGGAVISGVTKAARASRILKNLSQTIRGLRKLESVQKYLRASREYREAAAALKNIDRVADAERYAREAERVSRLEREIKEMEQIEDVKKYVDATKSYSEINQYRHALRGMRTLHAAQRGNVMARAWRALRAANSGGKMLNRGAKIARSGMKSGRVRDWLFQSTLLNAGKLARMEEAGGLIYGTLHFVGDMYDWTDTETDQFTNGIEFAPLLLLSADDLQGQENVVNYGMWLLWAGDSISPNDDDAAFLQAMDFAQKFYQDIGDANEGANSCHVDIYVVRPIIRNPGEDNAEIYYLIMNDEPWRVE